MKVIPLTKVNDVHGWQACARNAGLLVTNLYPEGQKIDAWIKRKAVFGCECGDRCRLLVVKEADFDRLFYMAVDMENAAYCCGAYQQQCFCTCVLDVVGHQQIQNVAQVAFGAEGFAVYKTLTRMQRRKGVESCHVYMSAIPRLTVVDDAIHIKEALDKFFDTRAEQLPSLEETIQLCASGASYVAVSGNMITAFLLGEICGKRGMVRYWFTAPEGRGKGVGSVLMHAFIDRCLEVGASYQELWVLDDNENAIKRYKHYGFVFDRLKDTVFVKGGQI